MTAVRGGPAGPDGIGGAYQNEVETDRSSWWYALGGRQGVLKGFTLAGVGGLMALDVAAGAALVSELDGSGNAQQRGYVVWADATTRVTFGAASASNRNDALVAAFVDTEDGAVGTGALAVGAHLVVIPGVSGTTTVRTDAQIRAWLGRGGYIRLADVPIASTDTQINTANIVNANILAGVISSRRQHATATSYTTGVAAIVPFDTSMLNEIPWDTTNKYFVVPSDGYYQISGSVHWAPNATGYRTITIRVNGTAVANTQGMAVTAGGAGAGPHISTLLKLTSGDTVALWATQGSGGALALTTSSTYNYVDITRVG